MSRRNPVKPQRPTRITIPTGVSPHVKLVFAEMQRQNITYDQVEERSGVLRSTLKAWRSKNAPGLTSIEAVLGCLGFDFVPVPRANVLPKPLLDELAPVAERHALTMTKTIEAVVEIVTHIHDGVPPPAPPAPARATAPRRRGRQPHPDQPAFWVPLDEPAPARAVH